MSITNVLAKRISGQLYREGFAHVDTAKVLKVANGNSLENEPALESAILQQLEEYGF